VLAKPSPKFVNAFSVYTPFPFYPGLETNPGLKVANAFGVERDERLRR
jgi:hypothetical protein